MALLATSLVIPIDPRIGIEVDADPAHGVIDMMAGILFWTIVDLRGIRRSRQALRWRPGRRLDCAPIMAAAVLGGPTAAGWVALIGSTDLREIRGRVVWYGTLANHAAIVLPAIARRRS